MVECRNMFHFIRNLSYTFDIFNVKYQTPDSPEVIWAIIFSPTTSFVHMNITKLNNLG